MYDYLKLKHELVCKRNAIEGIKTEFCWVALADIKDSYQNTSAILNYPYSVIPEEQHVQKDATHLILQKNLFDPNLESIENSEHLNMQLRMLDMTRTLDFMLQKRAENFPLHKEFYNDKRKQLKEKFENLTNEKNYEHELIKIIHESGLDTGLRTVTDYEQLLDYYRTMAGLLDPASILESVYKDNLAGQEIIHQDVSVPVTVKTTEQKKSFEVMKSLVLDPDESEINFHSGMPAAFQEVNIAFSELIKLDNRRLGAQARTYLPSVPNAYVVRYAIKQDGKDADVFVSGRSASPAYMGKKENEENVAIGAQQNIEQLQLAATQLGINQPLGIIHLASNTFYKRENQTVKHTKAACAKKDIAYNNIPTNWAGIYLWNAISDAYQAANVWWLRIKSIFSSVARYTLASSLASATYKNRFSFFICLGGKDRSGITLEKAQHDFAVQTGKYGDRQHIEEVRSKMANAVQINTIANEGAPGIKQVSLSQARGLFREQFAQKLSCEGANHNKEPKIGDKPFFDKGPEYLDILGTQLSQPEPLPTTSQIHQNAQLPSEKIEQVQDLEDLLKIYHALSLSPFALNPSYFAAVNVVCDRLTTLLAAKTDKIKVVAKDSRVRNLLTSAVNRKIPTTLTWNKLQQHVAVVKHAEAQIAASLKEMGL